VCPKTSEAKRHGLSSLGEETGPQYTTLKWRCRCCRNWLDRLCVAMIPDQCLPIHCAHCQKRRLVLLNRWTACPSQSCQKARKWLWEIKLDGYRAVAVKSSGTVTLYSRNRKILNKRFPYIVEPLRGLPDGSVVDGEIVALDDGGRPVFNLLQNFTSESARIRETGLGRS
jgi:hypothetical protein